MDKTGLPVQVEQDSEASATHYGQLVFAGNIEPLCIEVILLAD